MKLISALNGVILVAWLVLDLIIYSLLALYPFYRLVKRFKFNLKGGRNADCKF